MNHLANKINMAIFKKDSIVILCVISSAIISGIVIANEKWLLLGVLFIPLTIYLCIEKTFILPFGIYVFLIPFESILSVSDTGGGTTLTKLIGILTIGVLFIKGAFEKKLKRPDMTSLLFVFFAIYAVFSISWANQPDLSLEKIPTLIGLSALYFIVSIYSVTKTEFTTIKWFILIGGMIAATYIIYYYSVSYTPRATLSFGERSANPNNFAFMLTIPLAVCIQSMMDQNKKSIKIIYGACLAIIFYGIIITGSRGGFLGAIVLFSIYFINMKRKIKFIYILAMLAILITFFMPTFVIERWTEAVSKGGSGRTEIWYAALHGLYKYWAFGAGYNNFPLVFNELTIYAPSLTKTSYAAHNIYIEIFIELGLIGITLLVLAIVKHYKAINTQYGQYSTDSVMLKAALWSVLIQSFFLGTTTSKSFWLLWMMIMMYRNIPETDNQLDKLKISN